jgi:acetate kinase
MRKLLEAEAAGNERAKLAVDVFCYRLRKYIASYVGVLGGLDALVFTGGIGENAPLVRARSVEGLGAMGITVDPSRNEGVRGREAIA